MISVRVLRRLFRFDHASRPLGGTEHAAGFTSLEPVRSCRTPPSDEGDIL